jgi:ADP-heptose:LPS heptosyltransferase
MICQIKNRLIRLVVKTTKGIGKLIAFARNKDLKQIKIKNILVNRSDRIGDAIITLPFLLELKKQGYYLTIMTSTYNDFILNRFFPTTPIDHPVLSQESKPNLLWEECLQRICNTLQMLDRNKSKDKANKKPQFDIFLDLMLGEKSPEGLYYAYKNRLAKYYIGCNKGPLNIFQDYSLKKTLIELSEFDIIQYYEKLLNDGLGIKIKTPDNIDLESFKKHQQKGFNFRFPFGVVFIGGESKRNLTIKQWKILIEKLAEDINIVVIDDPKNLMLPKIKDVLKYKNVYFIKNRYNLFELLTLTQKANFFIGMDGGGTHILSLPTNTMMIFSSEMKNPFRPHSNNSYKTIISRNDFNIEETKTSNNLIKAIAHKSLPCRPCFVKFECRKRECIKGIDVELIAEYMRRFSGGDKNV